MLIFPGSFDKYFELESMRLFLCFSLLCVESIYFLQMTSAMDFCWKQQCRPRVYYKSTDTSLDPLSYITTSRSISENCSFFSAAAKVGPGASAMKTEGLSWGISEKAEQQPLATLHRQHLEISLQMKKHRRNRRRLGVSELPDVNMLFFAYKEAWKLFSREATVNSDFGARNAEAKERWREKTWVFKFIG